MNVDDYLQGLFCKYKYLNNRPQSVPKVVKEEYGQG